MIPAGQEHWGRYFAVIGHLSLCSYPLSFETFSDACCDWLQWICIMEVLMKAPTLKSEMLLVSIAFHIHKHNTTVFWSTCMFSFSIHKAFAVQWPTLTLIYLFKPLFKPWKSFEVSLFCNNVEIQKNIEFKRGQYSVKTITHWGEVLWDHHLELSCGSESVDLKNVLWIIPCVWFTEN